jgi:hypothetical protein
MQNRQDLQGLLDKSEVPILKGVDVCAHTRKLKVRAQYEKEHDDAQRLKNQRSNIGSTTHFAASSKPRIFHEAKKRRVAQVEKESSKGPTIGRESRLVKILNVQERKEVETRVARVVYVCGDPFNVVRSPYWQDW